MMHGREKSESAIVAMKSANKVGGLAEASGSRLLRLLCRSDKWPHASHVPKRGRVPLDAQPTQAQPAGQDDMGENEEAVSSTFRILRSMAEGVRKSLQEGGRDLYGLCAGPGPG